MSIKANELRLGNWLESYAASLINGKFEDIKIRNFQVDIETLKLLTKDDGIYATIKPISLTPEILTKCGFKNESDKPPFEFWVIGENPYNGDYVCHLKRQSEATYYFFINIFYGIKYLHQLQNLYSALTQTELNINL